MIRNTAGGGGGGIFSDAGVFTCVGSAVRLSPNKPNDPPAVTSVGC